MSVPRHLGLIIDGNRRWAVKKGLSKLEGHHYGAEALRKLIPAIIQREIPVVSIYTFSTENWRRTAEEVSILMTLIGNVFRQYFDWFKKRGARVRVSGRIADFPEEIQKVFSEAIEATKENTKLVANFCLSYGGREEIIRMAKKLAEETGGQAEAIAKIDEAAVERNLYTSGLPDVDLVIRTGGDQRLSNFLPWQCAYAELYFTKTLWPDFDARELDKALEYFAETKRNFGK